jgi:hypothetical protein
MRSPAKTIIGRCGGPEAVAKMLGVSKSCVYRWMYPKERGGTGGHIPAKHQTVLLKRAAESGISLEPSDFFPRTVIEGLPAHAA